VCPRNHICIVGYIRHSDISRLRIGVLRLVDSVAEFTLNMPGNMPLSTCTSCICWVSQMVMQRLQGFDQPATNYMLFRAITIWCRIQFLTFAGVAPGLCI